MDPLWKIYNVHDPEPDPGPGPGLDPDPDPNPDPGPDLDIYQEQDLGEKNINVKNLLVKYAEKA